MATVTYCVETEIIEDPSGLASVTSAETWMPLDGAPDDEPPCEAIMDAVGYVTVLNPGPRELADATSERVRRAVDWLTAHWGCDPLPVATHDDSIVRADGSATLTFLPSEDLVLVRDSAAEDAED